MELHPLAAQFASVADVYERGRLEYAPAAIGALAAELGLRPSDRVLDLAAGTGKLTRALIAFGFDVVAVEPQGPLLEKLRATVGAARVKQGLAEKIPLEDASAAAVTVADAFHWFDRERALQEIARVLGPGRGLAVISTVPDWRGASWGHDLGTIIQESRPEHPHFDGPPWQEAVRSAGGWSTPREIRVTTTQPASPERIVDHVASMSWIAGMEPAGREAMVERVRDLVLGGETPAELPLHVIIGIATRV